MDSERDRARREVFNLSQAAKYMGCSDKKMRVLADRIPHQRDGRMWFFLRSKLDAWAAGAGGAENAQA